MIYNKLSRTSKYDALTCVTPALIQHECEIKYKLYFQVQPLIPPPLKRYNAENTPCIDNVSPATQPQVDFCTSQQLIYWLIKLHIITPRAKVHVPADAKTPELRWTHRTQSGRAARVMCRGQWEQTRRRGAANEPTWVFKSCEENKSRRLKVQWWKSRKPTLCWSLHWQLV